MALTQTLTEGTYRDGVTTHTGVTIGTAAADRVVVVAFGTNNEVGITGTIGGVAANFTTFGIPGVGYGFMQAKVPTGTTATVVINDGQAANQIFAVWAIYGGAKDVSFDGVLDVSGSASQNVDVEAGGVLLGMAIDGAGGGFNPSWSAGLTNQGAGAYNFTTGLTSGRPGGDVYATAQTVTCTISTAGYPVPFVLSISPDPIVSAAGSGSATASAAGVGRAILSRAGAAAAVAAAAGVGRSTVSRAGAAAVTVAAAGVSSSGSVAAAAGSATAVAAAAGVGRSTASSAGSAAAVAAATAGGSRIVSATGFASAVAIASGASGDTTAWNSADADPGAVLSNGNLTLTAVPTVGVRSTRSWNSGKHGFTVYLDFLSAIADNEPGAGWSLAGAGRWGQDANGWILLYGAAYGGYFGYTNSGITAPDGTSPAPNVGSNRLDVLIDSDNNQSYFRVNGNVLLGANLGALTGGVVMPAGPHYAAGAVTDNTLTADFNPSGLPSGWLTWDGYAVSTGSAGAVAGAAASGTAVKSSVGSAAAVAAATGVGRSTVSSTGAGASVSTAVAGGARIASATGSCSVVSAATAGGHAVKSALGSAAVVAAASGVSAAGSIAAGVGTAGAVAGAAAVGSSFANSGGTASSVASAFGVGRSTAAGAGTAAAAAGATAGGSSVISSGGAASALVTALAVGRSTASSAGSAAVIAAASGVSAAGSIAAGIGNASSVASAAASGSSVASSAGSAAVVTTVVGAGVTIISRAGSAAVLAAALAAGRSTISRAANANVLTDGIASGRVIASATGSASVTTSALARSTFNLSTQPAALIV